MKTVTFFTIHQAPHNTFTFRSLEKDFKLNIFYYKDKLDDYNWKKNDFYYQSVKNKGFINHLRCALNSDLVIISGWQNYRHLLLIFLMLVFKRKFALYSDLGISSLRKKKMIKKGILKIAPFVFITGIYGEKFLKRYLKKDNVYNFPYGINAFDSKEIDNINNQRIIDIQQGNKIKIFISNRFIERKGYHLVRSLLNYLRKEELIDAFQFIIAGNGPLFTKEKELMSQLTNNILFLGWIDYNEYRGQMKICDIYLHCSENEPYGIPPLDAFVCKKNIILTKNIYSKYDINELGGKMYEFNYKKENELHYIFQKIAKNRSLLYSLNEKKNVKFPCYLFRDIHLKVINIALNT